MITFELDDAGLRANRRPKVSRHAQQRMKDRSIPPSIVEALLDFGERAPCGGGAETCYFTKRSWRRYSAYLGSQARHFELLMFCEHNAGLELSRACAARSRPHSAARLLDGTPA